MSHFNFKKWNTILGWVVFGIAFLTYALTIEPTVSFWDAGEYILTSSKLQVGHPPGAPLFQMFGAFFSLFALQPDQIGMMLNMMSAVASAFTILFMFWTITLLLLKLVPVKNPSTKGENEDGSYAFTTDQYIGILGSAVVGSLAFTFTDSFWFNAVETEVYAMATLIMAVLFWLALRWEQDMNTVRGNKWLILISFVIGLSFGVHFMGLLTIPAMGLIYFFKNYKEVNAKNFIIANLASVAILFFIFKLLLPNALKLFSMSEIFFVNSIGLPFNTGSIIAALILIALFYYGLKVTREKQKKTANTLILCLLFIFIGFSSWMMLPIRANAHVVINENNPSSARELLAYYNLEQYPETHLFYGPQFTEMYSGADENQPYVDDKPKYEKDEATGDYIIVNSYKGTKQNYNSEHASLLPRMWSSEHAANYMMFTGLIDFKIKSEYQMENQLRDLVNDFKQRVAAGEIDYEDYNAFLRDYGQQYLDVEKPSFGDNLAYMVEYQFGYMYWRYFMWNFVGRQNDVQGKYDPFNGNWISGIKPIDEWHLGMSQDNLPSDVLDNKARNTYYFLPLILGLVGFFFLLGRNQKLFWTMLVFFLLTGLAIQFYTNVRPFEPRERDYSVVGSFYVFSIWIGFGVFALINALRKKVNFKFLAPVVTIACLILVPGVLAANNWDDHDRSGRETAHAMAVQYLESCAPNAILFTIGDNDTFPLWYAQEIEGIRRDVRVVNTSLFQTDWYIDQMKRKAYSSDPIPSQLTHDKYRYGTRDYLPYRPITNDTLPISQFMEFISSDHPNTKMRFILEKEGGDVSGYNENLLNSTYFPTKNIRIPVDKEEVLANGTVKPEDADKIVPYIDLEIKGSAIYKNRLLMLDILANNNWERPIYFSGGAFGDEDYIWLKDYLQLDGLCYRLVPIKTPVDRNNPFEMGRVDTDIMYDKVMSWDWGNSGGNIYHDTETRKNGITYRGNLARLIEQLINEGQLDKAEKVADLAMEKMPVDVYGFYTLLEPYISAYYEVGAKEKARKLYQEVSEKYQEKLKYYSELSLENQTRYIEEIVTDIERYRGLVDVLLIQNDKEVAVKETEVFNNYLQLFSHFMSGDAREEPMDVQEDLDIPASVDSTDTLIGADQ
ncbi:Dolichyl-phosphate-mannose--protein O-mannosyl transferase [Flavobacteriaceae bacterium MAR_2010_188]|nr:Dolichyl-phosphate-mannose--protein O-mannosyl transferase [Flavobacteriaceae bacterium MAR_2010_188]